MVMENVISPSKTSKKRQVKNLNITSSSITKCDLESVIPSTRIYCEAKKYREKDKKSDNHVKKQQYFNSFSELTCIIKKPSNNNLTKQKRISKNPVCLLIEDIQNIKIHDSYNTLYGQIFKNVIIHGRSELMSVRAKNNVILYNVDDGSGSTIVHYSHGSKLIDTKNQIEENKLLIEMAKTDGMPFLEKNYQPDSEECIRFLKDLKIISDLVEKRVNQTTEFKHGNKIFVIGFPFSVNESIHIWAWHIHDDSNPSRIHEIYWKDLLVNLYETKYSKIS